MQQLFGEYYIKEVSREEFSRIWKELHKAVFTEPAPPDFNELRTPGNEEKKKSLLDNAGKLQRLNILVYHNNNVIGWMWGRQADHETFAMVNTGILSEYQGKGIYKALLEKLLIMLKDMGYEVVKSHHFINNNRVLLAKLKQGFVITGFEVSETFGTLIRLSYFYSEKRKELYNSKTGSVSFRN